MSSLIREQRKFDHQLPEDAYVDEPEFDKEIAPRFIAATISDADVERFITELATAPNMTIFFENSLGLMACDYRLEIAVARLWATDKEAVGSSIGPVFWRWARNCAIKAAA